MVPRSQKPEHGINSRHAGRENVGAVAAFELGHRALQGFAVRVIRSRVVVPFVFAELFVHVRRGLINRRDDCPGGGIGLLPDVNGVGGKTHDLLLADSLCDADALGIKVMRHSDWLGADLLRQRVCVSLSALRRIAQHSRWQDD